MKSLPCVVFGVILVLSVGYAAHDLACYAIVEPSGDYLEADSSIAPKLGIANLGDEAEHNFPVEFLVIDKWGLLEYGNDTVFAETTMVAYIGPYPDSIEVELPEWTPEGLCDHHSPFVEYEIIGVVDLETDEDRENDTLCCDITCLLSHDVGVIGIEFDGCWPPPDSGTPITITAIVENFGFHMEHDIPVRCEIIDWSHGGHGNLIYLNLQAVSVLDWRGNEYENPCTTEITFPVWTYPGDRSMSIECRTEMEGDQCPDNDFEIRDIIPVEEAKTAPRVFRLAVSGTMAEDNCSIKFAVPYSSWVKLDVFNIDGRWVKSIANDLCNPGYYHMTWDGQDAAGRKVATGVYLIRMQADEFKAVRKLVIVN